MNPVVFPEMYTLECALISDDPFVIALSVIPEYGVAIDAYIVGIAGVNDDAVVDNWVESTETPNTIAFALLVAYTETIGLNCLFILTNDPNVTESVNV